MRNLLLVLLSVFALLAQDTQGLLKGTIADPRGAAIAQASVEIRNEETGALRAIAAGADGYFVAPGLKPGSYTLTVSAPGFRKYVRGNVVLETSQPVALSIALEIGDVSQTVTVTSDGLDLDTAKADRTWTLRGDQLGELPMPDRNLLSVLTQVPGVNWFSNGDARGFTNEDVSYISVNGGSVRMNSFQIDGAPNNVPYSNAITPSAGMIGNNPTVDAVKEVKVITNVYDAQTGRTAGAVIQVNLKSGGREFHGSAYEYAYRTWLEGNTFQNNANNRPRTRHILDQTGFTFSGPILLPRIFDGRKHRSYFFTNYEYFRDLAPNDHSLSVPEPEMIDGDFSRLANNRGQRIVIYDPSAGQTAANGAWVRAAFAGNMIPASRIHPVTRKILGYMPKPNQPSATGNYSASNFFFSGVAAQTANYWRRATTKFDHEINASHRVSFRFTRDSREQDLTNNSLRGPGIDSAPRKDDPRSYALLWNAIFSPTIFAEFRLSANTFQTISSPGPNFGFDKSELGLPASLVGSIPGGPYFGRYDFSGYASLGSYQSGSKSNGWSMGTNITKVRAAHTMKTGFDLQSTNSYTLSLGNPLQYSFADLFTRADYLRADGLSGNAIATALLGAPTGGTSTINARLALISKYFAGYFQDDWKVTRRLTLNLGFRYDVYLPITERYDRILSGFDREAVNPVNALINRTLFPQTPQLQGGVLFAGVSGQPRRPVNVWPLTMQPRFGFAYELTRRVAVRGGYGRSYWSSLDDMFTQYGYSLATSLTPSFDDNRTPRPDAMTNPFPSGLIPASGNALGMLTRVGQAVTYQRRDFSLPYQDQYSLNFQVRPHAHARLEAGYVRTRTYDMRLDIPENEIPLRVRQQCNPLEGGDPAYCNALLPNPFRNLAPFQGTSRYTDSQLTRNVLSRPMPQFDSVMAQGYNLGKGWYDAFQAVYELRSARGITLNASYAFSKNIQLGGAGVGGSGVAVPRDPQRLILDRSPNFYNRPHVFTFAAVGELPFGKGKPFLNNLHAVPRAAVSGWQLSSRFDLSSGILADMPTGGYVRSARLTPDFHNPSGLVQMWRPCVARVLDQQGVVVQLQDRGLNAQYGCAIDNYNWLILPQYAPRQTASFSLEYRRQPNIGNINLALNRNMRIGERYRFTLRVEAYNVFNRYLMFKGIPNADMNSALFGTIVKKDVPIGQTLQPRKVSASLKFSF
ncbi:MAG: TonB-dependent receptor [Candidatus Solibacter usitatus]|nr:TonB-dependent receptor [Candidatus Solibacter usitatus]